MRDYTRLEEALNYSFTDRKHIERALTHATFANENPNSQREDNARLEFLGDAVLELAVRRRLYDRKAPLGRGKMSQEADKIVNNAHLATVARAIGLREWLDFGKGAKQDKLHENPDIEADALEAVIGAVFIDGDAATALAVAIRLIEKYAPAQLA